MHLEIILEDREGRLAVDEAEPVKELDVLIPVESLSLDSQAFYSRALRNRSAHAHVASVDRRLVNVDVGEPVAPVPLLQG